MKNQLNIPEQDLKDLLDSYTPEYNPKAWRKIDQELSKGFSSWYYVAAAALMVVVSAVVYLNTLPKPSIQPKTIITENTQPHISTEKTSEVQATENSITISEKQNSEEQIEPKSIVSETIIEKTETVKDLDIIVDDEVLTQSNNDDKLTVSGDTQSAKPLLVISSKSGCEPFETNFKIETNQNIESLTWEFGDGYVSSEQTVQHQFSKFGTYAVRAKVKINDNLYVLEDKVEVKPSPSAKFKFSESDGVLLVENFSENYKDLFWTFPGVKTQEENPSFEMLYTGDYLLQLKVVNANACESVKQETINYKVNHQIFAPTAFTPNGNGINDLFTVKYNPKEGFEYTFQIFNAKGEKMFESHKPNEAWDGKNIPKIYKNTIEKYIWRLIIKDPRGYTEIKENFFTKLLQE